MIVMRGMQLFWICCAQLPTGACSGRHLALFPFHLFLLQDHSEYFTVSKKTAAPAIKAIFIQISGLQIVFLLKDVILRHSSSHISTNWTLQRNINSANEMKTPINFQSLKTASFYPEAIFPTLSVSFMHPCFVPAGVCLWHLSSQRCIKTTSSTIQGPSFVCQWFIISLIHVRLMKSGFKVAQRRGPLAYYHSSRAIRVKHLPE